MWALTLWDGGETYVVPMYNSTHGYLYSTTGLRPFGLAFSDAIGSRPGRPYGPTNLEIELAEIERRHVETHRVERQARGNHRRPVRSRIARLLSPAS